MKILITTTLILGLFSVQSWALTLPEKCEALAWKIAEDCVGEIEGYADIVDVSESKDNTYSALVRPVETDWYVMTFKYLHSRNRCLLLKLEGSYL